MFLTGGGGGVDLGSSGSLPVVITKTKRQRRSKAKPEKFKRNINMTTRHDSLLYQNEGRKLKSAISMGNACESTFCFKSKHRHCSAINTNDMFWIELTTWSERKLFISTAVKKVPTKQNRKGSSIKREFSYQYFFTTDNVSHKVWQKMFASYKLWGCVSRY